MKRTKKGISHKCLDGSLVQGSSQVSTFLGACVSACDGSSPHFCPSLVQGPGPLSCSAWRDRGPGTLAAWKSSRCSLRAEQSSGSFDSFPRYLLLVLVPLKPGPPNAKHCYGYSVPRYSLQYMYVLVFIDRFAVGHGPPRLLVSETDRPVKLSALGFLTKRMVARLAFVEPVAQYGASVTP